jgi:hypothetical protein
MAELPKQGAQQAQSPIGAKVLAGWVFAERVFAEYERG